MVLVPSSALWDSTPPVWRCWRHGLDALWINWLWGAKGVVRSCCHDIMRHLENQRCWIFLEWPDDVCSLLSRVSLISGLLLIQNSEEILVSFSLHHLRASWWRYGMTGGGGAAEVRSGRRTMFAPGVGIPLLPGRLVLMLLLLSASWPTTSQACPGLLASTSGCSCTEERSKAHGVQSLGRRVSCSKEELSEPPDPSLLPNRTATLWVSTVHCNLN